LAAISAGQENALSPTRQPKPAASAKSSAKRAAYTSSFFGTQPRITQVPP